MLLESPKRGNLVAKSKDERQKDAQVRELAKAPDGRRPGNHASDVSLSHDAFYREVFADGNVRPVESMQGNYAKCVANNQPKHKGKTQL